MGTEAVEVKTYSKSKHKIGEGLQMLLTQLEIMHEEGLTLPERQLKLETTSLQLAAESLRKNREENFKVCHRAPLTKFCVPHKPLPCPEWISLLAYETWVDHGCARGISARFLMCAGAWF